MIRHKHHNRIIRLPIGIQRVEHPLNLCVDITHISPITPNIVPYLISRPDIAHISTGIIPLKTRLILQWRIVIIGQGHIVQIAHRIPWLGWTNGQMRSVKRQYCTECIIPICIEKRHHLIGKKVRHVVILSQQTHTVLPVWGTRCCLVIAHTRQIFNLIGQISRLQIRFEMPPAPNPVIKSTARFILACAAFHLNKLKIACIIYPFLHPAIVKRTAS